MTRDGKVLTPGGPVRIGDRHQSIDCRFSRDCGPGKDSDIVQQRERALGLADFASP